VWEGKGRKGGGVKMSRMEGGVSSEEGSGGEGERWVVWGGEGEEEGGG
jgi:hypothetical protein